jgi:hypothetical protein
LRYNLTTFWIHDVDCAAERRIVRKLLRQSFWLRYRLRDDARSEKQRQKMTVRNQAHIVESRKALLLGGKKW